MKLFFAVLMAIVILTTGFAQPVEAEVLKAARDDAMAAFSREDYERWENWTATGWLRVVTDPNYDYYRTLSSVDLQRTYSYALYLELNSLYFNYLDANPGSVEPAFYNSDVKKILEVMPKSRDEIQKFVSSIRKEEQVASVIRELARERPATLTRMYVSARLTVPLSRYHVFLFPQTWRDDLNDEFIKVAKARRTTTIVTFSGIPVLVGIGILGFIVFRRRRAKRAGR